MVRSIENRADRQAMAVMKDMLAHGEVHLKDMIEQSDQGDEDK